MINLVFCILIGPFGCSVILLFVLACPSFIVDQIVDQIDYLNVGQIFDQSDYLNVDQNVS